MLKKGVYMKVKDVDATIKKLLHSYAKHCRSILDNDLKRIQRNKYKTQKEFQDAKNDYYEANKAYEFLLKIANEPKKYLYTGEDIIYAKCMDGETLYTKLSPILGNRFDRSLSGSVMCRVSECIKHHVLYGENDHNGNWICYNTNNDLDAKEIFKYNQKIQLWHGFDIVNTFKGMFPSSWFATDAYKQTQR